MHNVPNNLLRPIIIHDSVRLMGKDQPERRLDDEGHLLATTHELKWFAIHMGLALGCAIVAIVLCMIWQS